MTETVVFAQLRRLFDESIQTVYILQFHQYSNFIFQPPRAGIFQIIDLIDLLIDLVDRMIEWFLVIVIFDRHVSAPMFVTAVKSNLRQDPISLLIIGALFMVIASRLLPDLD